MHWREQIPLLRLPSQADVVVWAGDLLGAKALPPPPDSYGSEARAELGIWHVTLKREGWVELPPASSPLVNRALYFYQGNSVELGGLTVPASHMVEVEADKPLLIANKSLPNPNSNSNSTSNSSPNSNNNSNDNNQGKRNNRHPNEI